MKGYPGLTPFLETQAELMGLTALPGQRSMAMARHAKAIQLIEGHIGQAARTHEPAARADILANAEDHLLSIELQLRTGCMMLVDAYQRADLPVPEWLGRYRPAFDELLESDPTAEDDAEDDGPTGEAAGGNADASSSVEGEPPSKPKGRRRAVKP